MRTIRNIIGVAVTAALVPFTLLPAQQIYQLPRASGIAGLTDSARVAMCDSTLTLGCTKGVSVLEIKRQVTRGAAFDSLRSAGILRVTGLSTFNGGLTVASGQNVTLTGTTIIGQPTYASNQFITLGTVAQPNVTSLGNLIGLTLADGYRLTFLGHDTIIGRMQFTTTDTIGGAPVWLTAQTIPLIHGVVDSATGAAHAQTLTTARTLWGQTFDGSANVSGDLSSVGSITFLVGKHVQMAASDTVLGTLFVKDTVKGSPVWLGNQPITLSTASQPNVTTMANLATVGTVTSGVWHGTVVDPTYGGTGVNNGSSTITLGGSITTSGAYGTTLVMSGTTTDTLPTTGTLAIVSGNVASATKLQNARTLWGQSFDGTANVTGSLTAVGSITGGASSMTVQSGTGLSRWLRLVTTDTLGGANVAVVVDSSQRTIFSHGVAIDSGTAPSHGIQFGSTAAPGTLADGELWWNGTRLVLRTGGASHALADTTQASLPALATVGTITSGTWNGGIVQYNFGGTGQSSYAKGDIVYASGVNTLSKLTVGSGAQFLFVSSGAPAWHTLVTADVTDLTAAATGITSVGTIATGVWQGTTVGVGFGGTGLASYTTGDLIYASGTTVLSKLAHGTSSQFLISGTTPAWHTLVTADISDLASASTGITSIGTLSAGAVPASLVTAGTFGAGSYTFQSNLTALGTSMTWGTDASGTDIAATDVTFLMPRSTGLSTPAGYVLQATRVNGGSGGSVQTRFNVVRASADALALGQNGSGLNNATIGFVVSAPIPTGSASGGTITIQTPHAGGSSSTPQSLDNLFVFGDRAVTILSSATVTLGGTSLTTSTVSATNGTFTGTVTLTGASITGAPTWGSNQAITLSTAAQPNITSVGTLTSLGVGAITSTGALSVTTTSSPQATFAYDGSHSATVSVASNGNATLNATGTYTITPATTITGPLTQTALATFNGGATIASGQTLTVTSATITGLTAASVGTGTFPGGSYTFTGATTLTGGAGNFTLTAGSGASRTLTFQTTTGASIAKNTLVLGADSSATFLGAVTHNGATTLSNALTYGGVTLSNAVTGTGNMVLSASPTLTGTLTAAALTMNGTLSNNGNFNVTAAGAVSGVTTLFTSGNGAFGASSVSTDVGSPGTLLGLTTGTAGNNSVFNITANITTNSTGNGIIDFSNSNNTSTHHRIAEIGVTQTNASTATSTGDGQMQLLVSSAGSLVTLMTLAADKSVTFGGTVLINGSSAGNSLVVNAGASNQRPLSVQTYNAANGPSAVFQPGGSSWTPLSADEGVISIFPNGAHNQTGLAVDTMSIRMVGNFAAGELIAIDMLDANTIAGTDTYLRFVRNTSGYVVAGSITTDNGATTSYNTTSDQRLKLDLGVATTTTTLKNIVIHDFTWRANGARGRGVFAQEAYPVTQAALPNFIQVGSDSLGVNGLPVMPWSADYSKLVPDLVVGWQQHDAAIADLQAFKARVCAAQPTWCQ